LSIPLHQLAIVHKHFAAVKTLATIILSGTAIRWYDNATNGLLLPTTTPLQNGITYYASQTENGCESTTRLAVTIELINTLPASNYEELL
jgi:hypothetical protein